ncbi:Homocysteine S-methyltransferase 3 [Zea mays]|uniref:Homocysteine S-methyltransferase 3 n=2 Tax=Zea mays TaxID=4577 RepID=A0A3L6DY79_MAIZE|nr:hypothetical protein ZEAMMB73_Zm00001d020581 [Zea mays]PWZ13023.1 Homocysteine S-methyltransferase 3 [Zea mays]
MHSFYSHVVRLQGLRERFSHCNSNMGASQESTGVSDGDFVSYVNEWCIDGATLIGSCYRTTPNTIRAIHRTLNQGSNEQQLPLA